ncbi:MAG TPA: hypothetical protein PK370_03125 [Candidatus Woesebacteria bacterium]|nr:hypothetical protein [Candidatus Woesebacteria bacterium]HPJ16721.1 hypothetical protein [Candidatus Woesebacteria bacterium]
MSKDTYWWMAIIVLVIFLTTVFTINGIYETKRQVVCKQARIRPFTEKFFYWGGILELSKEGKFQPSCL